MVVRMSLLLEWESLLTTGRVRDTVWDNGHLCFILMAFGVEAAGGVRHAIRVLPWTYWLVTMHAVGTM